MSVVIDVTVTNENKKKKCGFKTMKIKIKSEKLHKNHLLTSPGI